VKGHSLLLTGYCCSSHRAQGVEHGLRLLDRDAAPQQCNIFAAMISAAITGRGAIWHEHIRLPVEQPESAGQDAHHTRRTAAQGDRTIENCRVATETAGPQTFTDYNHSLGSGLILGSQKSVA
jgi:hypothetical protein